MRELRITDIVEEQMLLQRRIRTGLLNTTHLAKHDEFESTWHNNHIRQKLRNSKIYAMLPKGTEQLPIIEVNPRPGSLPKHEQDFLCFDKTSLIEMIAVLRDEGKDEATVSLFIEVWMSFETWYFSIARTLWRSFPRIITCHESFHLETNRYCEQCFRYDVMDVFQMFFGVNPRYDLALYPPSQLMQRQYQAALLVTEWKKNAESRQIRN